MSPAGLAVVPAGHHAPEGVTTQMLNLPALGPRKSVRVRVSGPNSRLVLLGGRGEGGTGGGGGGGRAPSGGGEAPPDDFQPSDDDVPF